MTLSNVAARGAATTLVGQWFKFVLHVASLAILARLLTPADYGTVSMVMALAGLALVLGDFGLSLASIQSQDLSRGQRSNLFWINSLLGIVLSTLVYFAAPAIASFYGRPELVEVVEVVAAVFLINALTSQFRAEAVRKLRFLGLAVADVISQALALCAAVLAALNGLGYWSLIIQQIVLATTTLVLMASISRWYPGLPKRHQRMGALLTFGANTLGVQVINYASANVDSVLLGRFSGATALGYYDRAYQLFKLPLQQIAAPMTRVALPILSKLNGKPAFDTYLARLHLLVSYIFGAIFFYAIAVADPLLNLFLGGGWNQTIPLFQILAIGGFFQALGYVYYWVFLAKAKTGLQLKFTVATRSLMIALIVVAVNFGAAGVAIAVATGLAVNWLVLTVFAMPRVGISSFSLAKITLRPVLLYSVSLAACRLTDTLTPAADHWVSLSLTSAVMLATTAILGLLIPPIRRDIMDLLDTARRIRKP